MTSAAKDMKQYRKRYMNSYAYVTVNWQNQFSTVSHYLVNQNMCIRRDSEFSLIGVLPRETVAYVYALYQETSGRIFKESLFLNSKKKKKGKKILKSLSKQKDLQR